MNEELYFKAIQARAILNIFLFSIMGLLQLKFIFAGTGSLLYAHIILLIVLIIMISVLIKRRFFTDISITIGPDYIVTSKGKKYSSSQIETIYMGWGKIGFRLKHYRMIPIDLQFSFPVETERQAMNAIRDWAERNNKQVEVKNFMSWL